MQATKAASKTATSRSLEETEKKWKKEKKLVKVRNSCAFPKFSLMNKKASTEEVEEETKVSEPEEASANTDAPLAEKTKEPKDEKAASEAAERQKQKAEIARALKKELESIRKTNMAFAKMRLCSEEGGWKHMEASWVVYVSSRALEEIEKKWKEKKKLVTFPKLILINKKASTEEVEEETKVSEPEEASANTDAPLAEKTKEPKDEKAASEAAEREKQKAEKAAARAQKKAAGSTLKALKTLGKMRIATTREESLFEMFTMDAMRLLYRMWTAPAALAAVLIVALGYYLAFVRK